MGATPSADEVDGAGVDDDGSRQLKPEVAKMQQADKVEVTDLTDEASTSGFEGSTEGSTSTAAGPAAVAGLRAEAEVLVDLTDELSEGAESRAEEVRAEEAVASPGPSTAGPAAAAAAAAGEGRGPVPPVDVEEEPSAPPAAPGSSSGGDGGGGGYGAEGCEGRLAARVVDRIFQDLAASETLECCETLALVLGNLLKHPDESKYRTLKKANAAFSKKLGGSRAALELLLLTGFEEDGAAYHFPVHGDRAMAQAAFHAVQDALWRCGSAKAPLEPPPRLPRRAPEDARQPERPEARLLQAKRPLLPETAAAGLWKQATAGPADVVLRLTTRAGRSRLVLPAGATLEEVKRKVQEATGVAPDLQRLTLEPGARGDGVAALDGQGGYIAAALGRPLRSSDPWEGRRPLQGSPQASLEDLGLRSGAAVYLLNSEATIAAQLAPPPPGARPKNGPVLQASKLRRLSAEQVASYWADGVLGPLDALNWREASDARQGVARLFMQSKQNLGKRAFHSHALHPWIYDLACHPAIVGAVASVLRSDTVLLYGSIIIGRSPGKNGLEETGTGWHADGGGYRPLQPQRDFITAFVAITACRSENGCLEFQPRSRRSTQLMELNEGQFSLHSATVQHQATRNTASFHRLCLVLRYISGDVRDVMVDDRSSSDDRDWAVLATGQDKGTFRLLPRPEKECGADGQDRWEAMRILREQRYGKLV